VLHRGILNVAYLVLILEPPIKESLVAIPNLSEASILNVIKSREAMHRNGDGIRVVLVVAPGYVYYVGFEIYHFFDWLLRATG